MTNKFLLRTFTFSLVLMLTACTLPLITPPADQPTPTVSSFVNNSSETVSPTTLSAAIPVVITSKNAGALAVVNKAAVSNVQQVVWASDSHTLALSTQNSDGSGTQLFGVTSLNIPDLAPMNIYSTQSGRVSAIAVDGRTAALISLDLTTFSLIDLGAGNAVILTITPGFLIGNVTFSPDLRYIAVTKGETWEVVLYSLVSGEEVRVLKGFETAAPVFNAGFKESPQWMVWHARGTIQLQELETGKLSQRLEHEDFISAYALTSDGTILASASGKTVNGNMAPAITLWDAPQGIELKTLTLTDPANAIAFSADGKLLAVGAAKALQLWDLNSGELLASLEGHTDQINTLAFSPDGKFIATSGLDNQLYLWQVSQ